MKKLLLHVSLFLLLMPGVLKLPAQQLPITLAALYDAAWYNPAARGYDEFNRFYILHQQRNTTSPFVSLTQQLLYNSRAMGEKEKFGYSAELNIDQEFTLQRTMLSASIATHLLHHQSEDTSYASYRWSLGAKVGMIRWGESFTGIQQGDLRDPILAGQTQNRLDLGFGTDASWTKKRWEITGGGAAFHLREWMLASLTDENAYTTNSGTSPLQGSLFNVRPHVIANLQVNRQMGNAWMGATFLYKELLGDPWGLRGGQWDGGILLSFPAKGIWFNSGVRAGYGDQFAVNALHAGGGLCVWKGDSLPQHPQARHMLTVQGHVEYPLQANLTGPRFEVGIKWTIGQLIKKPPVQLIRIPVRGPLWYSSGNAVDFFLDRTVETDLNEDNLHIQVNNQKQSVTLTYSFSENNLNYHPEQIPGARSMLVHIAEDVLTEAFEPKYPWEDSLKYELTELKSIEIEASIKEDQDNHFSIEGARHTRDTLQELIILDERDSLYYMEPTEQVRPVDLAFLKLVYFRDLLVQKAKFDPRRPERFDPKKVARLKLTTNNPNQKAWQRTTIRLEFSRKMRKKEES